MPTLLPISFRITFYLVPFSMHRLLKTLPASLAEFSQPSPSVVRVLLPHRSLTSKVAERRSSHGLRIPLMPTQPCSSWTRGTPYSLLQPALFSPARSSEATILTTAHLSNLLICTVSHVLIPPPNLTRVIAANNLTGLAGVAGMVDVPDFYGNGTNATITEALEANRTRGYTLFAPDNEALESAGAALASFTSNNTALLALIGNHVCTHLI
jgi:hypothetical protein